MGDKIAVNIIVTHDVDARRMILPRPRATAFKLYEMHKNRKPNINLYYFMTLVFVFSISIFANLIEIRPAAVKNEPEMAKAVAIRFYVMSLAPMICYF